MLVSLAYLRINYEVREGLKCTWVSLFKGFNKSPYGVVRIIVGVCCNKYYLVVVEITCAYFFAASNDKLQWLHDFLWSVLLQTGG